MNPALKRWAIFILNNPFYPCNPRSNIFLIVDRGECDSLALHEIVFDWFAGFSAIEFVVCERSGITGSRCINIETFARAGANNGRGEDNRNRVAVSLGSPDQKFGYLDFPVLGHGKTHRAKKRQLARLRIGEPLSPDSIDPA